MKVNMPAHQVIPNETFAAWLYEPGGHEPAFELKLSYDGDKHEWELAVTPMHMDGSEAETVTVVAR